LLLTRMAFIMISVFLPAILQAGTVMEIRYQDLPHYEYHNEIMKKAFEETEKDGGPVRFVPNPDEYADKRLVNMMTSGDSDVDIMIRPTDREIERQLDPIRIPVDRGILGWRIAVIRQQDKGRFSAIRTEDEIRQFTAGQGFWVDADIYKYNGYQVASAYGGIDILFRMLEHERFDYVPLGANECRNLLEKYKISHPDSELVLEETIVLNYPFARYFWTVKNEKGAILHERLTRGLEAMIRDGSFDRIFVKYSGEALREANLAGRKVFDLENPSLPATLPLDRKELWFSPGAFEQRKPKAPDIP